MDKYCAKVMVVWTNEDGTSHDQILNIEVDAASTEAATCKAYAEAQSWLGMTYSPGGCEVQSVFKKPLQETVPQKVPA